MTIESSHQSFNATGADVTQTRNSLAKPIGEIITDILGDRRVQELFESAGKHPDEYAGEPTGLIAMKLGVVTKETKNALLIAQAAERTYSLAGKVAEVLAERNSRIGARETYEPKEAGVVGLDDPIFKFVGSDRDPQELVRAQATWMAAQAYLNQEVSAVNAEIEEPYFFGRRHSQGAAAIAEFKAAAADFYAQAAAALKKEGHDEASDKLSAVADKLDPGNVKVRSPHRFLELLLLSERSAVRAANDAIGRDAVSLDKTEEGILNRLLRWTTPAAGPAGANPALRQAI